MKRYQFKLQKILDLKRIRETQAQKKLGEELREMRLREAQLQESVNLKENFDRRFHEIDLQGTLDPIFFRRYKSYQNILGVDIRKYEEACTEQNTHVDEARGHLQSARRKTQVFENLEEVGKSAYWSDVRKEDQKIMGEVALQRFNRRAEQGKAVLVLMAIGASGFIMSLMWAGLLWGLGYLDGHRMALIGQIMRYRGEHWKDVKQIVGEDRNYLITKTEFDQLEKDAKAWREEQAGKVDDEVVITKEVLDERRGLLDLLQTRISRDQEETVKIHKSLQKQEDDLVLAKKSFNEEKSVRHQASADLSKKQKDKAQEEMLQSFKSMDPADVVKVLTGGVDIPSFPNEKARQTAVTKVSDYISKMDARQRAGILQELSPEWAGSVVKYLEENYSL